MEAADRRQGSRNPNIAENIYEHGKISAKYLQARGGQLLYTPLPIIERI
jgi:hypothetical protein